MPVAKNQVDNFDFAQFEGDLETSSAVTSFPYLQMQGVPNVTDSMIEQLNPEYGWFLSKENAEAVNFKPSADWKATVIKRDGRADDGKKITIESHGFISRTPRCCIVLESQIEIQEQVKTNKYPSGLWQYRGEAFDAKGEPTQWRQEQQKQRGKDDNKWCMVTRRLILLVGPDNSPLHDSPLAFSCRGGWGGNMGIEIRDWRKAVSEKLIEAMRNQGINVGGGAQLGQKATAFGVFQQRLGWNRTSEEYSPSITVIGWDIPTHKPEMVGKVVKKVKGDKAPYDFSVTGIPFSQGMVSKISPAGELIAQWQEAYAEFLSPQREEGEKVSLKGRFGGAATRNSDGSVEILFNTSSGSTLTAVIPQSLALIIDVTGDVQLTGLELDGRIKVSAANAIAAPAPAPMLVEETEDEPALVF